MKKEQWYIYCQMHNSEFIKADYIKSNINQIDSPIFYCQNCYQQEINKNIDSENKFIFIKDIKESKDNALYIKNWPNSLILEKPIQFIKEKEKYEDQIPKLDELFDELENEIKTLLNDIRQSLKNELQQQQELLKDTIINMKSEIKNTYKLKDLKYVIEQMLKLRTRPRDNKQNQQGNIKNSSQLMEIKNLKSQILPKQLYYQFQPTQHNQSQNRVTKSGNQFKVNALNQTTILQSDSFQNNDKVKIIFKLQADLNETCFYMGVTSEKDAQDGYCWFYSGNQFCLHCAIKKKYSEKHKFFVQGNLNYNKAQTQDNQNQKQIQSQQFSVNDYLKKSKINLNQTPNLVCEVDIYINKNQFEVQIQNDNDLISNEKLQIKNKYDFGLDYPLDSQHLKSWSFIIQSFNSFNMENMFFSIIPQFDIQKEKQNM
ncbi:hypothetical protein PPERSA_11190 [Pseudocohnilembus persalinus]|uniref:Uncharacterized protein n=1 Tax=Pseudocohnilembus persalinus TaxID=266149 RepID=A0A0V0QZ79_PSEPJ|nr:hypothetical protein PPERSA_11190 [Pseudocohnilembus persalinus]|eukprot:KRX07641.1 hypothetical protein PPERSA_11190 [Pseudocohnilembus persalinus]